MSKVKDYVIISKKTWEDLKDNPTYTELIELIEDREALLKAMKSDNKDEGIELHEFLVEQGYE